MPDFEDGDAKAKNNKNIKELRGAATPSRYKIKIKKVKIIKKNNQQK